MLKFNGHAETVQKILDVVKKRKKLCFYGWIFIKIQEKQDRLHGMVTLCIYYGEKEWDGPLSLVDMLDIPDKLKFIFSDYKFNLIQMRSCNNLHFHNYDINTVFDLSSSIYNRDYEKINKLYKNQPISPELALVVGAITESQELIESRF